MKGKTVPAPRDLIVAVADLIHRDGIEKAAAYLGLARETVARVAAGVPVHPGTLALVREKLGVK